MSLPWKKRQQIPTRKREMLGKPLTIQPMSVSNSLTYFASRVCAALFGGNR